MAVTPATSCRLDNLPSEIFCYIFEFLDLDSLHKLLNYNDWIGDFIQNLIDEKLKTPHPMHYACCTGDDGMIRYLVQQQGHSLSEYASDGLPVDQENGLQILGCRVPMNRLKLMLPLLTAAIQRQVGAVMTLLELGAEPPVGFERSTPQVAKRFRHALAQKGNDPMVRKLLEYGHGRRLLNLSWDWVHPDWRTYPHMWPVSAHALPDQLRSRVLAIGAEARMEPDTMELLFSYWDGVDREGSYNSRTMRLGLLSALITWDDQHASERLIKMAVERGFRIQGYWRPQSVDSGVEWLTKAVPVYMAARRLAQEGVKWPVEACIVNGADINAQFFTISRIKKRRHLGPKKEAIKATPLLTYLLSIPWTRVNRGEDGANRVLAGLDYLISRGAYMTRSTCEEKLPAEAAGHIKSRRAVDYSPVDLLLAWWTVPDDHTGHALEWGCYFEVVRGLVERGCDGPRLQADKDVYERMMPHELVLRSRDDHVKE